ncbi:MAG: redox-sensing transcriptional repressor Rex [Clostridia bacterium]|nr:redox-sensing transcriptional repressor Rex [Clostridia bacterium]MBR2877891.1 redox-sensing transcriptional repressor Rex [Clostridia bacterium]MBR2973473.1 redox-sensing transcriptional repressor Rex [Clostridia bacterium]
MPDEKMVSPAVIRRLPRYYRYLSELMAEGITRISSKELSERMQVTASQIRQDLNCFGGFGQQGFGYNVENLYSEIAKIMGIDGGRTIVIVGVGNLGRALAGYDKFAKRGFKLMALFDNNPSVIGTQVNGYIVQDAKLLPEYVRGNKIDVCAVTIPKMQAQGVVDKLVAAGIKGIWNFSHCELSIPDSVALENVHMSDSLMTLSCKISRIEK